MRPQLVRGEVRVAANLGTNKRRHGFVAEIEAPTRTHGAGQGFGELGEAFFARDPSHVVPGGHLDSVACDRLDHDGSEALAMAVERDAVRCCTLDIAGPDLTSQNDLTDKLRRLTNRSAPQAPLPELFASWGLRALDAIGINVPFTESQLRMLI